jgi:hypothetical protein
MRIGNLVRATLALLLAGSFAGVLPRGVATAEQPSPSAPAIDEDASAALARMNKTLLARQFSFSARTLRSYAGPNGEMLHIVHGMKTVFRRPDRLSVDISGDDGSIDMLYDGKEVTLYGMERKQYATIPVTGNIDQALDAVEQRTGTDFPLAELLSDDPEQSVLAGVTSGRQVGFSTIDGVQCRHLFFVQAPDMEFELWLEDNEQALPRRFVVTYRSLPGRPMLVAEISDWDFSIDAADSDFEFDPPVGATKVELPLRATGTSVPPKD